VLEVAASVILFIIGQVIMKAEHKPAFSSRCLHKLCSYALSLVVLFVSLSLFIINLASLLIFFNIHAWRCNINQNKKLDNNSGASDIPISTLSAENTCKISILIVTFNDSRYIGETLRNLESNTVDKPNTEVLLIDLGSTDSTFDVAKASSCAIHVKCIKFNNQRQQQPQSPSRAKQANEEQHSIFSRESAFSVGSSHAKGEILLLLRPDALLQNGYDDAIRKAFMDENTMVSSFKLNLYGRSYLKTLSLKVFQSLLTLRNEEYRFPHLMQGISVRANIYGPNKTTKSYGLCEDLQCMHKIRLYCLHHGKRIITLPQSVTYPAQRWDQAHIFKYLFIDQIAFTCHRYLWISAQNAGYLCSFISSRLEAVKI
jgi:hypothetical protein